MNAAKKLSIDIANATCDEILAQYNQEAKKRGLPKLKSWARSKEALALRIVELCKKPVPAPKAKPKKDKVAKIAPSDRPVMIINTKAELLAEVEAMPVINDALSIKDVSCLLLTSIRCTDPLDSRSVGFSYSSILYKISKLFPESNTSNACLRWYLVRIRQEFDGFNKFKMPIRFKRPKSRV